MEPVNDISFNLTFEDVFCDVLLNTPVLNTTKADDAATADKKLKDAADAKKQADDAAIAAAIAAADAAAAKKLKDAAAAANTVITFDELKAKFNTIETYFSIKLLKLANNIFGENTIWNDKRKTEIAKHAQNSYTIYHTNLDLVLTKFLNSKKQHKTDIELEVYNKINTNIFIKRLLINRPYTFYEPYDSYYIPNKPMSCIETNGTSKTFDFTKLTTNKNETLPQLENFISYDEMELSAFLGCSVQTYFINEGDRRNEGKLNNSIKHVESGYYFGMVGARFERQYLMDWKYIIITEKQNIEDNGYITKGGTKKDDGKLLCHSMYGETCLYTYKSIDTDLNNTDDYITINNYSIEITPSNYTKQTVYFNINAYKKRLSFVFEPFFLDANARYDTKKIYCHVVGLGIGAWAITDMIQQQTNIYI